MEHTRAVKNIQIANEKIKAITEEIEALEIELRRTQKEDGADNMTYSLKVEQQINMLLKVLKINQEKVKVLEGLISNESRKS